MFHLEDDCAVLQARGIMVASSSDISLVSRKDLEKLSFCFGKLKKLGDVFFRISFRANTVKALDLNV